MKEVNASSFFLLMLFFVFNKHAQLQSFSFLDSVTALGPSIYLKGLPLDATPALLENEFQRFGLIKTNGIQVRSQKVKESHLYYCLTVMLITNVHSS